MIILILDTSPLITERLAASILEARANAAIYEVTTYENAVRFLQIYQPDLVIADWKFSGNRSPEIIEQIRTVNKNIVAIILAHSPDTNIQEKCKRLAVDFLLDKYEDFERIPVIIEQVSGNLY